MSPTQPHGQNLRKGRWSRTGQIYVVTFVTHQRTELMADLYVARIVVRCLNKSNDSTTLAYVVMPDHVHWMLQIESDKTLSAIIQATKSSSAHLINRWMGRKGKVWQKGFHDHAIRNEESLRDLARYIVANPLRAGIAKSVREYPHWDAVWI